VEKGVLEDQVRELQHLRQDIHDGLSGYFTALAFKTTVLQRKLAAGANVSVEELNQILDIVGEARGAARALSKGLSPVGDGPDGLAVALEELASRQQTMFGVPVSFTCAPGVAVQDVFPATQAYRIVQEAVANAARHGAPSRVSITMCSANGAITLAVRDDGVGIPPDAAAGPGMGLRTMRHRARLINASLSVSRHPEGGTLVTLRSQDPRSTARG
jgi:signal transduction histidine kinase